MVHSIDLVDQDPLILIESCFNVWAHVTRAEEPDQNPALSSPGSRPNYRLGLELHNLTFWNEMVNLSTPEAVSDSGS